jgi:hypothetical protein
MLEIPRRKLLGMTMAVFGFFTTQSNLAFWSFLPFGRAGARRSRAIGKRTEFRSDPRRLTGSQHFHLMQGVSESFCSETSSFEASGWSSAVSLR